MFEIKVYNRLGNTLIDTVKPSEVLSEFSFAKSLNSGVGQLVIKLAKPLTFNEYALGDLVIVTEYNDDNKTGIIHFKGIISKIGRNQTPNETTIDLVCIGVATLLVNYNNSVVFSPADKAGDVVRSIIDSFNSMYGGNLITYTASSIEDGPTMGTGSIAGTYLANITGLSDVAGFVFYINGEGEVQFKDKDNTTKHYNVNKKDVQNIIINEDLEGIVNSVEIVGEYSVVVGDHSVTRYKFSLYEDAASVLLYGKKHKRIVINANSQDYVDSYALQYVEDNKAPKKQTQLVINREYNIESLNPGDTVTIKNLEYLFEGVKIVKVSYTPYQAVLYLDEYRSFGQMVVGK